MTNKRWRRAAGVWVAGAALAAAGLACGGAAKAPSDVELARAEGIEAGRALAEQELLVDAVRASATKADLEGAPYRLNRETWRVTIAPRPIVRTRCWISTDTAGAAQDRDERVVEWDPSTSDSPERFVTLRRGTTATLRCAAESSNVGSGNAPDTITYRFDDGGAPSESGVVAVGGTLVHLTATDKTGAQFGVTATAERWSKAGTVPYSSRVNPPVSQGGQRSLDPLTPLFTELATVIAEVAVERAKSGAQELAKERLRGFLCNIGYGEKSSGPAFTVGGVHACARDEECRQVFKKTCSSIDFLRVEELAASAEVLGRGLAGDLTEYAFSALTSVLSSESERVVRLTVDSLNRSLQALIDGNAIRTERDFQALLLGLSELPVGTQGYASALDARLGTLRSAVAASAVAAADARATVARDKALLAVTSAETAAKKAAEPDTTKQQADDLARSLREAISAANDLARVVNEVSPQGASPPRVAPLADKLAGAAREVRTTLESESWRCAVGMGSAVLRECLERDTCSADALRTSFERELAAPSQQCAATLAMMRDEWPELPSILARAVDVMRPPPGTTPAQTAKAATVIVLEVLEKRALWRSDSRGAAEKAEPVRTAFDATKALTTALFDRDYAGAAVASARLVSSAIAQCAKENSSEDEKKYCDSLDPARLKKSLALLNGFVSYAASYRKEPNDASDGKSDAEREKARRDERKKAMNDLVDAMTDRSARRGEHIFSFGVGVGLASGRKANVAGRQGDDLLARGGVDWMPNLALPTGVAWDYTPGGKLGRYLGSHVQLSLLDVAQFLVVTQNAEVQDKPTFATAFLLGGQLGVTLGTPTRSVLVGADLGYAPGMKLPATNANDETTGVWRVGGFVGTYIPFIDFN